ncbi:FimV/HubP family polar landmark protein [Halioxenophilus sp. WMMB6]|uniref:FimV/HubP family polar landmark protein n=1 Tax=Halioxenophilus sp. WMMB6 TaxID=3073815 RepID=UPI00295EB0DD|nr:FimV/HubP family polar landmark protein [Halioxenophilus sp. WMMB6]
MRLSKLASIISAVGFVVAEQVSALGLGEIKLNSSLNEPLNAEIRLLQVRDLTEEEILVGLASNADFERVGVDKTFFLTGMKFSVDLEAPGGPVVHITTNSPVREPFLNFLIESQWPSGRILREYTLLMDLPVFSAQSESTVSAPATTTPVQTDTAPASSAPVTRPRAPTPTAPSSVPASYSGDTYGPVQASDTLWNIALKVRPGSQYTVQQTMIAIQRLNPEAFINNNINLLRKGQVLRVPTSEQISELSRTQAINEVAFQNDRWSQGASSGPTLVSDTRKSSATGPQSTGGRVTVGVGDDSSTSVSPGSGRGSDSQSSAALENDLAIAMEQLDTANRENTELKGRIADLEEQIDTMERLVEVSNEQLRALQLAAEQSAQDEDTDVTAEPAESSTPEAEMADASSAASEETPAEAAVEAPAGTTDDAAEAPTTEEATPPPAKPAPATKPDARTVVVSTPPEPSLVDKIMDNIVLVAAVLVAVLLAIFVLVKKLLGKKDEEEEGFDPFEEASDEDETLDIDGESFDGDFDTEMEPFESDIETPTEKLAEEEEDLSNLVPEEVIAEADIYIAYGKYDQAEQMLKRALRADPANTDARVKLLEVYAESGELEKFDENFQEVHASGNSGAIGRGAVLRSQFADAAPFAVAAGVAAAGSVAQKPVEELDFDAMAAELDDDEETISIDNSAPVNDFSALDEDSSTSGEFDDFDFDLDPEFESEETTAEPEDGGLGDEISLDMDFEDMLNAESDAIDDAGEDVGSAAATDSKFDFDFDDMSDSTAGELELESDSLSLGDDDDIALSFDLGSETETAEAAEDELDLSDDLGLDDFNLDLSSEESSEDELLSIPDEEPETLDLDGDFSLDFDEPEAPAVSLQEESVSSNSKAKGDELSDMDDLSLEGDELSESMFDDIDSDLDFAALGLDDDLGDDSVNLDSDFDFAIEGQEPSDDALSEGDLITPQKSYDNTPEEEVSFDSGSSLMDSDDSDGDLQDLGDDLNFDTALDLDALDDEMDALAGEVELNDTDSFMGGDELDDSLSSDAMFDEVLASSEQNFADFDDEDSLSDGDLDDGMDFLADTDESDTKLDLARAYIDMGDGEGARDILNEVLQEGSDQQKSEAKTLLDKIPS